MVTAVFAGCSKEEEKAGATETQASEESSYPERSINNIVPFGAGGGTDSWNRALSAAMEEPLGVKILVNNMTGGGPGGTGQAYVWDADHDGYTILGTSETPLLVPVMTGMEQTTKDFEYFIGGGSPGLLLVNKDAGVATIEELIEGANADPDKYKVASTAGGLWFILANLFSSYGDVPLGNVTYDGSRPAITACVSGETAAVTASAGLFPLIISVFLALCAFLLFSKARKDGAKLDFINGESIKSLITSREFKVATFIIGLLAFYIFVLLEILPYWLATFIYLYVFMFVFQKKTLKHIIIMSIVAVLSTIALTYGFGTLAMIPLP